MTFFHLFCVAWAIYLSSYFPESLRTFALIINILMPFTLFWFIFFIKQLSNHDHILRLIFGYFCISAFFSFVSAVIGPLAEGELPVIRIIFFGPFLYAGSFMSLLYASVILFYGYITYLATVLSASLAELIYINIFKPVIPKQIQNLLKRADNQIDDTATNISDRYFFMNQTSGLLLTSGLVAIMSAGFILLIVTQVYS